AGGFLLDPLHRIGDGGGVADGHAGIGVVTLAVVGTRAVVILGQDRSGPERQHQRGDKREIAFHDSPPGDLALPIGTWMEGDGALTVGGPRRHLVLPVFLTRGY